MRHNTTPYMLLTLASLFFVVSYLLLIYAGVNPFIALVWNVLSSLDVNFTLLPSSLVANPLVLSASLIDAFIFALVAVVLATFFFEFIKQVNIGKRFMLARVNKMRQHVIIVPYNSFAISLAKELEEAGEKCVFITDNEADMHRAYRQRRLAVIGDPKDVEAFLVAGIGRAKYVIACADEDLQNALISVTAKSANARAKIVSRVTRLENMQKLASAGAFRMITPEITVGSAIGNEIVKKVSLQ